MLTAAAVAHDPKPAEPWRLPYQDSDSTTDHVLGLWSFDTDAPTADSGPLQLKARLDGAIPHSDGKFGACLESFPGWPIQDKHHAMVVSADSRLSPMGAFTAELWLRLKADADKASGMYLLDKKYASHHDYQWLLTRPSADGTRRMTVNLGFGEDSDTWLSDPLPLSPNVWTHLAFAYDGAGTIRFFRDGSSVGTVTRAGRRSISPGPNQLCLGDRVGSNYGGVAGYLDEVRLCRGALEFNPAAVTIKSDRTVWLRREASPAVEISVHNLQTAPLSGVVLDISGTGHIQDPIPLPEIQTGQSFTHQLTFDTSLRPDVYDIRAQVTVPGETPITCATVQPLQIVARPLPQRMPVLMWGIGSAQGFADERLRLQQLGFTHALGFGADYGTIQEAGEPVAAGSPAVIARNRAMLDDALAHNMRIAASLHPGYYLKKQPQLARVDRDGKPYARSDCNAALPGLKEFSFNVGASVAEAYGDHPAFDAALVNSEVRDSSQPSFSEFDRQAWRDVSGHEIPTEVQIKNGVKWTELQDFPADRIIPDDHPVLAYYRWFWTTGDGWNDLHTALHRGLKSTGREDLWTWFDPTIRAAGVPGSGGEVDILSQWTYTEPSPLRVGYFCDEIFAMAAASSHQPQVMKMTQLFWYRSSSAPIRTGQDYIASPFDDHDPDAAYISIAPAHLRGSFWSKIARPIRGLMYHGWSSLVPTDGTHAYKYTQPDLQTEFTRLHTDVLPSLAPALLQIPDRTADVAYLNSFTSQMFARRGSYGYSHDEAYLTLQHAQLQPEVLLEDTLLQRGLKQFRILVLVDCDVLTDSVAEEIRAFRKNGGLIIGDPNLAPGITADITVPRFRRSKQTDQDKQAILKNAATLQQALQGRYRSYVRCSNPELVPRTRTAGESDYVFLVNDHREFGTYVGQHGLVMEHGLPSSGTVTVQRPGLFVYDLVRHRQVSTDSDQQQTSWTVNVGPCDGRCFLATPIAIDRVLIDAPAHLHRETTGTVEIVVADAAQQPVPAVIPVTVSVTDPHGRAAEASGFYAVRDGRLSVPVDIASNDVPGVWQVEVTEGASGRQARTWVRVQ